MSETPREQHLADEDKHWLVRSSTIRKLWIAFAIILGLTLVAQLFVHLHEYFVVDAVFGFYAAFGFFSCVAMVVVAKLLGLVLKQPDDFYDEH
ncbi:hypothetical protein F6455_03070 [Proteobacteria bacterium 005FR1]|nr:hypothetical protein [Proteobacteria bacterium 005FR1]